MSALRPTESGIEDIRRPLVALILSWAAWVGLAYLISDGSAWEEPDAAVPFAAAGGALLVVSALVARGLRRTTLAELVTVVWSAALLAGMWAAAGLTDAGVAVLAGHAAAIALAATVARHPATLLIVTILAGASYLLSLEHAGDEAGGVAVTVRLGVLAVVGVLGIDLVARLRQVIQSAGARAEEMTAQEAQLTRQQHDLARLYEVSRSIGAGSSLAEVLPDMVGRIVRAIGAETGLVLYYDGEESLQVLSPIWVAGKALRAEGYAVPLRSGGLTARVFVSSTADYVNEVGSDDPLLAALSAQRVAAVPLRIEARSVGVLLVADAPSRFTADDLAMLESLAAPAAMIVENLFRFEMAQEHGARMSELAQLKSDFVSVVSHELRTPLTSIIGALSTMSRPELAPSDPNSIKLLSSARRQADRLKRLIEDLLTVSRLDARSLPMRPEPVAVAGFVRDVVATIPHADSKVTVDVPARLPTVETDPEHLRRILTNLIENALKHAPGSAVEVRAAAADGGVEIMVVDHGPGIPPELTDQVFQRFTQVGPHETRVTGGTGLGLSIVHGLAEALGGRVWHEPTKGGGATFTVALPQHLPSIRVAPGG